QAAVLAGDGRTRDASSIVFSDARELIESMTANLDDVRQTMSRAAASREGGMANEQSLLAGGLMSIWIVALILLVPIPSTPATVTADAAASSGSTLDLHTVTPASPDRSDTRKARAEQRDSASTTSIGRASAERSDAASAAPTGRAPAEPAGALALSLHDTPAPPTGSRSASEADALALDASSTGTPGATTPAAIAASMAATSPVDTAMLQSLAALCADLGAVADVADLDPLLARTATLMSARGVVVWLVNSSGEALEPAVAHGYDIATLARVGALPLADSNLTSTAYRERRATISRAAADHAAAVAVPIVAAAGPVGVLAAEVDGPDDLDRVTAIAGVVSAQLANLFASPAVEPA
ncbi:MAG: GAF domain-containing protein, partial [Acidobacteria bacterium]|nr:GAF domain-containing protein [Acidobacteriota bacterium]